MNRKLPLSLLRNIFVSSTGTNKRRKLFPLWMAPRTIMMGATLAALVCFSISVYLMVHVPWFGAEFGSHPEGVEVLSIVKDGPSEHKLKPGDIVVGIRSAEGEGVISTVESLITSAYVKGTFNEYNSFFVQQGELIKAIANGGATLQLLDGSPVVIDVRDVRPITDVPWSYWLLSCVGVVVFVVGVGVWVFRSDKIVTRLIAVSAFGYMLSALTLPIYTEREWLLPPQLFSWLSQFGHFGSIVYGFSAMLLFWYFPKPLGRFPMSRMFFAIFILFLANELSQIIDFAGHVFIAPYLFALMFGGVFAFMQWRNSSLSPLDRAALLWFLRSTMLSNALVIVLYFMPQLFGYEPFISLWACVVLILGLYVGVVLGVLRFRLFDLDRWWFVIWVWFFGGLLVVVFDFLLIYYAGLQPAGALTLSLLAMGWVYFPLRQWLWTLFMHSPSQGHEDVLPEILEVFFDANDSRSPQLRWQQLLMKMFDVLHASSDEQELVEPRVRNNGMILEVPGIEPETRITLEGRNGGTRLFNRDDLKLAAFVYKLARKLVELKELQEQGASLERERIARDLHDDVAPQLLTLMHMADSKENVQRARTALQTLRESIYSLSDIDGISLEKALSDWRAEACERADAAGARLRWQQVGRYPHFSLSARQHLNLTRVLREAISNALKHAEPEVIDVVVTITDKTLSIALSHEGKILSLQEWRAGKGLNNMQIRIKELGGKIDWQLVDGLPQRLMVGWDILLQS